MDYSRIPKLPIYIEERYNFHNGQIFTFSDLPCQIFPLIIIPKFDFCLCKENNRRVIPL